MKVAKDLVVSLAYQVRITMLWEAVKAFCTPYW